MCANVAFEYCNMLWGIEYAGYSAPADVAFLIATLFIGDTYFIWHCVFLLEKVKEIIII